MHEVFLHPEHNEMFLAAAHGDADWDAIYDGYTATVDWPGAAFWRELAVEYPDAKVLLSERDPKDWYESYRDTVYTPIVNGGRGTWDDMVREVIVDRDLGGVPGDPEHVMARFEQHNADVRAEIDPDRLLVYRVTEGWGPLCAFLGVDVPDEPFPHTNDRASFLARNNEAD